MHVVLVQPLPSILILESNMTGFESRLLRRGWRQRRELVRKIFYCDDIPLSSFSLSVMFPSSFSSSLASPLVRSADHIGSGRFTGGQKLLLLSQEVCLTV